MKTEIKLITPEMAKKMLEKNINNRRLSPKKFMHYAHQMKKGQWKLTGQGISFDKNNNLIDGQNRLNAIIQAGVSVEMLCIYDLDIDAFEVYDTGKTRNASDVLYISGVKNDRAIASGISFYYSLKKSYYGERASLIEMKLSNSDVLDIYFRYSEYWQKTFCYSQKLYSKVRLMKLSNIIGLCSFLEKDLNYERSFIQNFFNQLFMIDAISFITIGQLRDILLNAEMGRYKLDHKYKMALIIKTWNFYVQNKDVKRLKWNNTEPFPKFINN